MSEDETVSVDVSATTEVDLGCRVAAYLNNRIEFAPARPVAGPRLRSAADAGRYASR